MNGFGEKVNFSTPRSFLTVFKSDLKETLFPDDPFRQIKNELEPLGRTKKVFEYFIPVFQWLPKYKFHLFRYDLLAGITIASLAIPQGISYAKLANIPPIIGLYSSFVPPLVYAIFGSSKDLAVGTVAAASLLLASTLGDKVSATEDPALYLRLIYTSAFFTGIFQLALGVSRLGILIDFLSHSTIIGFMGGTATIISLQQLKGVFDLTHFTSKTDIISVMKSVFSQRKEWRWESAVVGICFLSFLLFTKYLVRNRPKLFWVSAIAPMATIVVGCVFAYLVHGEKHGIQTVGHLNKGLNPSSLKQLNFNSEYLPTTIKAGIITGILALAEGIAIGRSFAVMKNYKIDGNKEMIAFGIMNLVGSLTSCYLTTGSKTQMSNVVMSLCMMLTLLFLAPLFRYTPLVALSAIIMSAMFGLIKYDEAYRLFKVDKFDFCICMAAFLGVSFISMDIGLMLSIGLSIVRALLYVARPGTAKLGNIPSSTMFRDIEQYPSATEVPGILILQLGSPIYFANSAYIREKITRWIEDDLDVKSSKGHDLEHLILDFGGVTSIDMTGIEMLFEVQRDIAKRGIKVVLVNPRVAVLEKLMVSNFIETIGKESVSLSIEEAIEASRFMLNESKNPSTSNIIVTNDNDP
ncbi:probable sulfate transporter 3.5 isoform X2 [Macadamia integrifolia]|uniref:probable sulfate transporter 3.5 isoform X2 n=1 Tax=Macadamia integrifolia TaxID=60698 RepID=UPI001C4FEB4F|nr:probable sulfate transporter 3.5 isoform X2 [Macadamia integrifolia]